MQDRVSLGNDGASSPLSDVTMTNACDSGAERDVGSFVQGRVVLCAEVNAPCLKTIGEEAP